MITLKNERNIFFSVIIPTYNRADLIGKTIESVLRQSYAHFEIIVVDDGSKDNTQEVVENIKSEKIHYHKKENGERGAARNYGMQRARGDYITFLDSDDLLFENYLQNAVESLQKHKYPLFFHLGYAITDTALQPQIKVNYLKNDDWICMVKGNPLSCLGVFMHYSLYPTFQFREDRALAGSEDWELWIRIIAHHGIKTDNRISAALINHEQRSVLHYHEKDLVSRKSTALCYAFEDEKVQQLYGKYKKQMEAHFETYVALHLVLSNQNRLAWKHFFKALKLHPAAAWERRTLALIKYTLLNMLRLK